MNASQEHDAAEALIARLEQINEGAVTSLGFARGMPRFDLAKAVRLFFKGLGIKKVSIRTPNYSMAQGIDIRLPKLQIHQADAWPHDHSKCCGRNGCGQHRPEDRCQACARNAAAETAVEELLCRAFPKHDNRSDSSSDYFDYCFSIG